MCGVACVWGGMCVGGMCVGDMCVSGMCVGVNEKPCPFYKELAE